jgi:hypothetical protein
VKKLEFGMSEFSRLALCSVKFQIPFIVTQQGFWFN